MTIAGAVMLSFTANIGDNFLFNDLPFLDRIPAARAAGFDKVECHYPYDIAAATIRARCDAAGVAMTGLNTRAGATRGCAGRAGEEEQFRRDFAQAFGYARVLGCSDIHVMAGVLDGDRAAAITTYIANLRWAGREVAGSGITLVLEPLNVRSAPNYLFSHVDELADVIREIGDSNVKLLFDVFHIEIMGGDLVPRIRRHRDVIGHVQVAGVPDRHEPDGRNTIDIASVFAALEAIDYRGLVGLEYTPRARTEDGLAWLRPYR